jgi:hypothetical protein
MLRMMRGRPLCVAALVFCVLAVTADARSGARSPTTRERAAITAALPMWLRAYPVGCVWLAISISSTNPRFAKVAPQVLNTTRQPCARYVSNGVLILWRVSKWRVVYDGSVRPPCRLHIPRDLTRCTP